MNVISVVLGADTKKFRSQDSVKIIEYAYENYEQVNLKEKVEEAFNEWQKNYNPTIEKGEKQNFEVVLESLPYEMYSIKKGTEDLIEIEVKAENFIEAPLDAGIIIGSLNVTSNGEVIYELAIKNAETINKKDVWQYFIEIIRQIKKQ